MQIIRQHLSRRGLSKLRKKIRAQVSSRTLRMMSFNECFPNVEKTVHPIAAETLSTPEATEMPFTNSSSHLHKSEYMTPAYYTCKLHDVYFSPETGTLLTKDKTIIKESINSVRDVGQFKWSSLHLRKTQEYKYPAVALRSVSNEFYHTVFSNIPRLYALNFEPYTKYSRINLLVDGNLTKVESFFLDKMLPDNVKIVNIDKRKLYLMKDFIFLPFLNRQFCGYLPNRYVNYMLGLLAPNRPRNKHNRIFISRKKAPRRRMINEDKLYKKLQGLGFQEYCLEDLPINKQIELFYDAEAIVALHGAGLANLIYSEQAPVLELFPHNLVKPTFYFTAKSRKSDYYFYCAMDKYVSITSDTTVDVDKVFEMTCSLLQTNSKIVND